MAQHSSQEMGRLYFAYGSNLSTTQMHNRCPYSIPIGLAHLTDWTWIINERGYANIIKNKHRDSSQIPITENQAEANDGQAPKTALVTGVYGLVYQLDPEDESQLDRCEGVGYAYEREMLNVEWADVSRSNADQNLLSNATTSPTTEPMHSKEEIVKRPNEETTPQLPGHRFQALVYVDFENVTPSSPQDEYVDRMNVGIQEASEQWGLPLAYVDAVIRPYIPAPTNPTQAAVTNE